MKYFLREISRGDIFAINQWRNDPAVINELGAPFRFINQEVDDSWYASYLGARNNNVRLAIACRDDNKIVGAVYLTGIDWLARSAEFSIWIGDQHHQGNGAGKMAAQGMLKHAFVDLGLNRIYLTVLESNGRARSLYARVGFSTEGVLREAVFKCGKFSNLIQMSILASEFKITESNDS